MINSIRLKIRDTFKFSFNIRIFLAFGVLIVVTILSSVCVYLFGIPYTGIEGIYKKNTYQAEDNLKTFADLKKQQLVDWINDRIEDAEIISKSFYAGATLERFLPRIQEYRLRFSIPQLFKEKLREDEDYRQLTLYLDEIQSVYYGYYESIYIADTVSGTIVVSTEEDEIGSHAHTDEQDLKAGQEGVSLVRDAHGNEVNFVISRIINTCAAPHTPCADRRFMLHMHANFKGVLAPVLAANEGLGKTAEVVLVDRGVRTLTPLKFKPSAKVMEYQISAAPAKLAASGNEGVIEAIDYRGKLVLAVFRHISITPKIAIGMVVKIDKKELMEPVEDTIIATIWLMVFGVFLFTVLTYFIALRISRPILGLIKASKNIKSGDLSIRAPIDVSGDLQILVHTFNDMLASIEYQHKTTETIAHVTRTILDPKYDKHAISRLVYDESLRLTDSKHGYISLIDEGTGDNGYNAMWGYSLNTAEGFYTNSPKEHTSFRAPKGHIEIKNFLSVPVKLEDRIIGQIALADSAKNYTEMDLSVINRLALIYGVAIARKDVEERLRDSEYRFRTMFEQAPVGIAIIASHTGNFIRINKTYCDIVGYSENEMLSLAFQEITHPEDIQPDLDNMRRLISGEISMFKMEKRYIRKDAEVVWVNLTCAPLWAGEEKPVYHLAIVEDITEKKQMSETVKVERDKLNGIMETMHDGIYIVNKDYDIEFANRAITEEFGEINACKCYEYFHNGTGQCSWCKRDEVLGGKTVTWEWDCPKNRKIYSHFDTPIRNIDGSISKFAIIHDISDIKNAQMIMKRELDFQAAIAEVSEALLSPGRDIVDISLIVNRQAMSLTDSVHGYVSEIDITTGDDVGHSITALMRDGQCNVDTRHRRLFFPKGKDGYNALWGHALNTKQAFYTNNPQGHIAYAGCIPEGHVSLERFLSVPAIIGDRLIGQIALANAERDYIDADLAIIKRLASLYALAVERKRMEEALHSLNDNLKTLVQQESSKRQMQEQLLIQQSKMAAMGEMVGLIAHQWKQPLNAIGITVQDMKDAYSFGEINEEYIWHTVDVTMGQVNFMSKTIDDFRNFFKPSKQKVLFDVREAIDELISMFIGIFAKNDVNINLRADHGLKLKSDGYPNEFKQVILNILNNSKDAIVSLRSSGNNIQGQIAVEIANDESNERILVSIRDNGGGIPEDVTDRIFEPYYTTKGSEGTGIGLYMSKTIIETNMGGSLTVRNVKDGAEFLITLQSCG
ncbi:MAG: PAS domain S-box protein [Nitrospirae bacterium]|uniref:PAS domain S-box protein n=1 Tax=Candidatus Magnetobacterium casense TaxID=1455061 RepID=UPI000698F6D2|nr:PAS domain S-box protein [Candidatus Magnetobacterium casensis]MBF0336726.1 PAS domain S-box protein [Nitrospirota bacterium]